MNQIERLHKSDAEPVKITPKGHQNTLQRVTNHHKTRTEHLNTMKIAPRKLPNSPEITSPALKRGRQTTNILKNRITQTPTVPNQTCPA